MEGIFSSFLPLDEKVAKPSLNLDCRKFVYFFSIHSRTTPLPQLTLVTLTNNTDGRVGAGENPSSYHTSSAARTASHTAISRRRLDVKELGPIGRKFTRLPCF